MIYFDRSSRRFVRTDDGALTKMNPPSLPRLRLWKKAAITVGGRPDWIFIKLHAHSMDPTDTDTLIAYFEKETQFDVLKGRKGYFRSWDHQLIQEAYPFTVRAKGQAKDKWDFLALGAAVPGANEPLEVINPTKEQNACTMS